MSGGDGVGVVLCVGVLMCVVCSVGVLGVFQSRRVSVVC